MNEKRKYGRKEDLLENEEGNNKKREGRKKMNEWMNE